MFWFFGHPEVYIAILPGFGIISHILPAFARKPLLGPKVFLGCLIAIGFLSYTVWGHHMFLSGMNPLSATLFSVPTLIITIPATIVTLLWIGTLYGARLRFTTAALFCLGFISVFVTGGISGFFLAQPSIDTYLHGTYFVVGHFHFVMGVAAMFGIFAGTYFWFPKMYGRMMSETAGEAAFYADADRGLLHLHADALPGTRRQRAPVLHLHRRLHEGVAAAAPLHHHCGPVYRCRAADLFLQSDPQPAPRGQGSRQSLAGDIAGVVDQLAAAVRQLRGRASRW